MSIHVVRRSEQLGVCSSEEIVAGLRAGRFVPSDLGWREGMAAWLPLGEWPEFRGIVAPPPLGAAALPEPTPLPWEESKSLASAVATVAILFRRPAEALPGARLSFGSTLLLAWVVLAAVSVFNVTGGYLHAEQIARSMREGGAQLELLVSKINGPFRALLGQLVDAFVHAKPKTFGQTAGQVALMAVFTPFFHLFLGFFQWLGLRLLGLFGAKTCKSAPLGRTALACLFGHALIVLCSAPVALFPPESVVAHLAMWTCFLVGIVFYVRVVGGALRIKPAVVFGSALLVYGLTSCCCACGLGGLIASFVAR